jgi:hypothetical protein
MAQFTGLGELDGLFKDVFGDGVINLVPEVAYLYRNIKLKDAEKQGKQFTVPVIVANSHGFTYNTTSTTAFSLNNSIAMTTQDVLVSASEVVLRDAIALSVASRSAGGNKKAFKDGVELVVENMAFSHAKRLEIMYWYGASSQGIGETSARTNVNTTTTDITFTAGSWADGIWSGLENCELQFRNAAGTLVSSGADSIFTVTRVNSSSRVVRLTGTTTGISALDTAVNGAAQFAFFNGAFGQEAIGVDAILRNAGTQFGIDAATFGLFRANTFDCGSAQLTIRKVMKAAALAYGRGLMGKATLLCSPSVFADLASDLSSYRRYDGSYKRGKADNGFENISIFAQNGEIEIIGHNIIKPQAAYLLNMPVWKRLGSTDITFEYPGLGGKIFTLLANNSGFELRSYADSCIVCVSPAQNTILTNIVPLDS